MKLFHFVCPVCDFDDEEAKRLSTFDQIYCGLCAEDNGHDVQVRRWPAVDGMTRDEAKKADDERNVC